MDGFPVRTEKLESRKRIDGFLPEAQIFCGTIHMPEKSNEEKASLKRIECAQVELILRQIGM